MNKEPIKQNFATPEAMAEHAAESYQIGKRVINKIELEAGFDISDKESIMNFKIDYTPLGNDVILKQIPQEIIEDDTNKLIPVDLSNTGKKWIVMVPGLQVTTLKKGDIVSLKGSATGTIPAVTRIFNKVRFEEIDYYMIGGVHHNSQFMKDRILEDYLAAVKVEKERNS